MISSIAAGWSAAQRCSGFHRVHKCTHEFPIYLGSDRRQINPVMEETLPCILGVINTSRFEFNLAESSSFQLCTVLVLFESSSNTSDPREHAPPNLWQHFPAGYDVGDSKASTGFQNSKGLPENSILVCGEIDHAVGDDHIDGIVGKRNALDLSLQELHVVHPCISLVLICQ